MVQKIFFALRAKTPAKLLLVASGGETHVPQARSEFLRISDICSFPVHCTLRWPVQVAVQNPHWVSAFLSVKQRSWYPKVPGEATVRNISKKCSHKMELRWWDTYLRRRRTVRNFFHHAIMPSCHHAIMPSCHHAIMPSCHHAIMPSCHHAIMPSCHHAIMPSCHHAIMPSCHHAIMPSCHHAIMPSCHHAIMPSCTPRGMMVA